MALLDALLLDPYRMNVWVAVRTDGVPGTGTHNDPYDGSTAAKFDALMNAIGVNNPNYNTPQYQPVCVHLGPGTFQTNGYADGVPGGWQAAKGMKIVGSGLDVTILQLVGTATNNAFYYAIGHSVSSGTTVDLFDVSDLTIDCNLAGSSATPVGCGAVRVFGNHVRVRHVKAINWGTRNPSNIVYFVIGVITATDVSRVEDCGIEDCVAINPASNSAPASNTGPITVFHAGGTESPPAFPVSYGTAPYIRNCFIDSGFSGLVSSFAYEIRGLSMAFCKAGIIEGNQAHNVKYGVFQQATGAQDIVIRNNYFKNVIKGAFLGSSKEGNPSITGSISRTGSVAYVTTNGPHNLVVGNLVFLNTSGTYNGIVAVVSKVDTSQIFEFQTSNPKRGQPIVWIPVKCGGFFSSLFCRGKLRTNSRANRSHVEYR